jgi:chromate transport protein ChrA
MLGLSWTYVAHGEVAWVAAVLYGLRAAVVAIVAAAVIRIGSRALKDAVLVAIPLGAPFLERLRGNVRMFVGMWRFRWRIVPVVVASAAAGLAWRLIT